MEYFFCVVFICLSNICSAKEAHDSTLISRMAFLEKGFSGGPAESHTEIYLVGKNVTGKERDTLVKRFAEKFAKSGLQLEHSYSLLIYKESDITNIKHLQEKPVDLNTYSGSNDLIWIYNIARRPTWISVASDQYENGKRIGGDVKHFPVK